MLCPPLAFCSLSRLRLVPVDVSELRGLGGQPADAGTWCQKRLPPVGAPSKPPGGSVSFSLSPTHHGPGTAEPWAWRRRVGVHAGAAANLLQQALRPAGASTLQPRPGASPPLSPPCLLPPLSSHKPPCSRTSVPEVPHGLLLGFSGSPNPSLPRCPPQVGWGRARIHHESERDRGDRPWGCPGGEDGPPKAPLPSSAFQKATG